MDTNYAELELNAIRALLKNKKITKATLQGIAEQLGLMTAEEMKPLLKEQIKTVLNNKLTEREIEAEAEAARRAEASLVKDTLAAVINLQEFKKRKRGLTAAQKEAKRKRNRKRHHKALRRRRSNVG